jgi:hypothetical protein
LFAAVVISQDGYTLEVDNNGDGYSDVSDICGALYDESAKCNKYMGNTGDYAVSKDGLLISGPSPI